MKVKNQLLIPFLSLILFFIVLFFILSFWFGEGQVILGHDSGFSLNAKNLLINRFSMWSSGNNFGSDGSALVGSWSVHLIDFLGSAILGTQGGGNLFVVLFWFLAIFSSSIIFSLFLSQKLKNIYIPLFLPFFFLFNLYVMQSIFIFEREKYSILVALPLFLLIAFKVQEKRLAILPGSIFVGIVFFIFNGGGPGGAPLYGGVLVTALCLYIFTLFESFILKRFSELLRLSLFYILSLFITILLDAYAIFPIIQTYITQYGDLLNDRGGVVGQRGWIDAVSVGSSFLNLFRLQGSPNWFTSPNIVDQLHPYASIYTSNFFLIVASFLIPMVSFLAIVLVKNEQAEQKRYIYFFVFLVLVGMFFSAGSRSPLAFLFTFFYENIPGFAIFRTPYFKFSYSYILGISVLLSFSIGVLIQIVSQKTNKAKGRIIFLPLIILLIWFSYHFVIFDKKIFSWTKGSTTLITPPPYLKDFSQWANETVKEGERILILPPIHNDWNADVYTWGYSSLDPLTQLLTSRSMLINSVSLTEKERALLTELYRSIKQKNNEVFSSTSTLLDIRYVLLRKDVKQNPVESFEKYDEILTSTTFTKKQKEFGKWIIYKLENTEMKKAFAVSKLIQTDDISGYFDSKKTYADSFIIKNEKNNNSGLIDFSTFIVRFILRVPDFFDSHFDLSTFIQRSIRTPTCISCLAENDVPISFPPQSILPGSLFYGLKQWREENDFNKAKSNDERIDFQLGITMKRLSEINGMIVANLEYQDIITAIKSLNGNYQIIQSFIKQKVVSSDIKLNKKIDSYLSFAENGLMELLNKNASLRANKILFDAIVNTINEIHIVRSNIKSVIHDEAYWETLKLYQLSVEKPGKYTLSLDMNTLLKTKDGSFILPKKILIESMTFIIKELNEETINKHRDGEWLRIPVNFDRKGDFMIKLIFPEPPNLLAKTKNIFFPLTTGDDRRCLGGEISQFKNSSTYKLSFQRDAENQQLSLVTDEVTKDEVGQRDFFQPKTEFMLQSDEQNTYVNYMPTVNARKSALYVCGSRSDPQISNLKIKETFRPRLFFEQEWNGIGEALTPPEILINSINQTEYRISIEKTDHPFILIFNERFSPLWKLYNGGNELKLPHFQVNSFANGWVFARSDGVALTLVYEPQQRFRQGTAVTSIGIVGVLVYLLYFLLKRKRSKK